MTMRKASRKTRGRSPQRVSEDDILPEYDFWHGQPNPYAARITEDTLTVVLDPDVARVFPDSSVVNDALRALARFAGRR